jgi:hypothetical protein
VQSSFPKGYIGIMIKDIVGAVAVVGSLVFAGYWVLGL